MEKKSQVRQPTTRGDLVELLTEEDELIDCVQWQVSQGLIFNKRLSWRHTIYDAQLATREGKTMSVEFICWNCKIRECSPVFWQERFW
jgi:hypothetical protein